MTTSSTEPLKLVVLISGSGTNLQAFIDAIGRDELNAQICAVISNRPGVGGLTRAEQAGIETKVLDHTEFDSREAFDQALMALIDTFNPQLVILAGYMRILTGDFVTHYHQRMLNIHPSLLPHYKGLNTHQRALDAGDREHGCSVHYVTEELDDGPVILQAAVPVLAGDDAAALAARVQEKEHVIYPLAVNLIASGRLQFSGETLLLDGNELEQPLQLDAI